MDEHAAEASRGLRRIDGYLYWQAETARADRAAEAFSHRLPWLTGDQREEVESLYSQEHLRITGETVGHIADRCRELRAEYEQRYHRLKLRLAALVLLGAAAAAAVLALCTDGTVGS
jgi:hypothetical protein